MEGISTDFLWKKKTEQEIANDFEESKEPKKELELGNQPEKEHGGGKEEEVEKHTTSFWMEPRNNPHIAQVSQNVIAGYSSLTNIQFERILTENATREKYRRRKGEVKTVIHWGQRKLLLSEIEFLTKYAEWGDTVIYAGAAPGTHINHLANLFKQIFFVLIDPAPFTVKGTKQIKVIQSLFTDKLAKDLSDDKEIQRVFSETLTKKGSSGELSNDHPSGKILFISDIRSADWQTMSEDETDARIRQDMHYQQQWHNLMKPKASLLKFRLSWRPGMTTYLSGDIYFPVWGPITTTESRLAVTKDAGTRIYDNTKYEEQMFYFNTVTRVALYPHQVTGEGIDHCYDCRAEIHILGLYLESKFCANRPENIWMEISTMSRAISRACAKDRTLLSPNPDPEERKRFIVEKQYMYGVPAYALPTNDRKNPKRPKHKREMIDIGNDRTLHW